MTAENAKEKVADFQRRVGAIREEIGRVIVGQRPVIDGALTCVLAGSHVLLEGVPGLGKTMLVRTLGEVLDLEFSRIQFTPDLMPADIIGTTVIEEGAGGSKRFEFQKGPIFSNIVLADEVNRATPKTQSALLEAMQEQCVTVGRTSHVIEGPYFVLATQNPLEMEGTYPLPEAQLDRFFFKLRVPFPSRKELHEILSRTTGQSAPRASKVANRSDIIQLQDFVRTVPVTQHVQDYAVRLLHATHPDQSGAPDAVKRFVRNGASPRGAQALILAAKIGALFDGRFAASVDDVKTAALPALRHRVLLNFEGEAEGVSSDEVIEGILKGLPESEV
ncbi:MAG: MoxR family ATPase [Polyangiaceae bacterium]|nr:MoxR family ATPase [Polyangiaceae bacterium]